MLEINNKMLPNTLRKIKDAPQKLYVLGNEKLLFEKCFAIIGSRNCTEKGKKLAKQFASKLARENLCIVSGMALGIDTQAHLGALKEEGKTIAVLGSGFNHIFPSENKILFKQIIENGGAVITEYEENVKPFSQGFALRNRIVSGLSMGVLVVEAKHRSGTAITAEFARRQGKKVFCIPHGIEEKEGIGTNRLIKNGAKLVTKPEDILKELKIKPSTNFQKEEDIQIEIKSVPQEYQPIYKYISSNPINIDELCKKTKLDIGKLNYILTMLELEGFITALPGKNFIRQITI